MNIKEVNISHMFLIKNIHLVLSTYYISKLRFVRRKLYCPIFKSTLSPFTAKISSLNIHFWSRLWCLEIITWFSKLKEFLWLNWALFQKSTLNIHWQYCFLINLGPPNLCTSVSDANFALGKKIMVYFSNWPLNLAGLDKFIKLRFLEIDSEHSL